MWVSSQFTTLTYVSYLSGPSTLAIILATTLIIVDIFQNADGAFGSGTSAAPTWDTSAGEPKSFFNFYASFSSFVFAYQGQDMFVEMMHEMTDQREAAKAVSFSYIVMTGCYTVATVLAYGVLGQSAPGFLPDAMQPGPMKVVTNFLVAFHIIIAYVITANLTTKVFYVRLFPQSPVVEASKVSFARSIPIRIRWAVVQGMLAIFCFLVASAIPDFGAVQELIGSLFGAPIVFGWPPFFYYRALKLNDKKMPLRDAFVCGVFFFVLFPAFTILGTIGSMYDIIDAMKDAGAPFTCPALNASAS